MSLDRTYRIRIERKFADWVSKNIPSQIKKVLDRKLKYFSENPNHPSLNTKPYPALTDKVKKQLGIDEVYEFYINRKGYRCVVFVDHTNKELIIAFAGNHKQVERYVKNS